MATIVEPSKGLSVLGEVWSDKCREAHEQFVKLKLTSVEMPFEGVGLQIVEGVGLVVGKNLSEIILRPMQLYIKYSTDVNMHHSTQKIYLQQVVTPFIGGNFIATRGYHYLVNTKKASGIQRLLTNFDNIDVEMDDLIKEANRFMFMYCKLNIY